MEIDLDIEKGSASIDVIFGDDDDVPPPRTHIIQPVQIERTENGTIAVVEQAK